MAKGKPLTHSTCVLTWEIVFYNLECIQFSSVRRARVRHGVIREGLEKKGWLH